MERGSGRIVALTLIGLLAIAATIGCSRTTRHKVLNVFFTGVPPLEEESTDTEELENEEALSEELAAIPKKPIYRSEYWVHGPYGTGDCAQCHSQSSAKGLRSSNTGSSSIGAGLGGAPSRLRMPVEELCVSCHKSHSNDSVESKGLWLHAPAAAGRCIDCHHPHQSRQRYMLRAAGASDLCRECHTSGDLSGSETHRDAAAMDCLGCHNAHIGTNSMLLIEEYDERKALYP